MTPKLHHSAAALTYAILAFAIASVAWSQEAVPDLFRQLDKNSDGNVSRAEAGNPRWFDALDADKDGLLSRAEVEAFMKSRYTANPAPESPPANAPSRPFPTVSGNSDGFVPDDVRVSPSGRPIIDPEFNGVQHRVAYWDYAGAQLNISVAELDPRTGLLKSDTGRDFAVAEHVAPNFKEGQWYSHNGPEWGRDRNGWAIYFTKEDEAGNRQMWRAVEKDGRYVPEQLTTKPGGHCGALISASATAPDTRMLFYINFDLPAEHTVAWALASKPNDFHPLPNWRASHSIARIVGEHHIGYAPRDKNGVTQVVLLDTRTGKSQIVTDEPGDKFDTHGFRAAEFGGELLMMANIDRQRLTIYRDVKKDGGPWQKIAELRLPDDSPFKYIYSCEPIAGDTGVNGTSYFSLNATRTKGANRGETGRAEKDGSIWVFSLGSDPTLRLVRRVDEGAFSGIQTTRYESESFVGTEEVFLYYERKDPETGRGELRRCRTGIRLQTEPPEASKLMGRQSPAPATQQPESGTYRPAADVVSAVASLSKPSLEVCLNANDEATARRFFAEGLGLSERPQPPFSAGGALRMLLFNAGASTIKVRIYQQPPAKLPVEIAARNGFRVLTVPVAKLDDVTARVKRLGFECGDVQQADVTRWALARNGDGAAFELIEAQPGAERPLEIGLVVTDLAKAREFFSGTYGAKELPEATSRVLPGERELRFTTGGTVLKCWAPPGEREADAGKIPDVLGFRYVTHNVRDSAKVHESFAAHGVEIPTPLASYQGMATLFMARGPGGVLLEFISFGKAAEQTPAAPATTTPQRRAMAGSAAADAMFQRLDRDGDGKIGRRELPNAERFKQLDKNGDGSLSKEELAAGFAAQLGGGTAPKPQPSAPANPNAPESNLPKDRPFLGLRFATDFHAARQTPGDPLSKATEANALEPHNGQLFCATSYMPESKRIRDTQPMILVKKSASGPWEVDYQGPPEFNRISILRSVTFTTDGSGKKLAQPVSVLVAGTGAWRSLQPKGVMVLSRDDATGKWHTHTLSTDIWNPEKINHSQETRMIFDHVDRITGVHHVFAGSATGRLYPGVYDASAPGLIRWDPKPELEGLVGNFLCAAEANGVAYFGVAYGPIASNERMTTERPVKDHGLFRRLDGPDARWEWVPVKEWEDPATPGRSLRTSQLRGLTAAPAPDGKGEVLLVAWDTRDAVIERIDPRDGFKANVELNLRDFLAESWGRRVGVSSFAYNDMLPVMHPDDGGKAHLIGLWVVDPRGEVDAIGKSSWYLVRYPDGTYRHQRIWDEKSPLTEAKYGLRGCRSIRPSPFPEEAGRVFYFCGFDQTGAKGAGATGPAAWVYKATLPKAN